MRPVRASFRLQTVVAAADAFVDGLVLGAVRAREPRPGTIPQCAGNSRTRVLFGTGAFLLDEHLLRPSPLPTPRRQAGQIAIVITTSRIAHTGIGWFNSCSLTYRNNPMPDLSTTYLGLKLANPFMVGASPLADRLDSIKRLEDAGCAAIVLHSLFEEQVTQSTSGRIREMDPLDPRFAGVVSYFPESNAYSMGPDAYLEYLHRAKSAVKIPVIGSINGTTPAEWLSVARRMEQAGADAIELNTYQVVTDADQSASSLENDVRQMVLDLKHELKIPLTVKLSPFYTAFAHVARQLERAGADGLVIFNRFLQPDIDVRHMAVWPRLEFSDSSELLLRLRWLAILHGRVRCSLAVTGGVATPIDGIKAILAGANVVQMVSAIMRHGPAYFRSMREELAHWMEGANFARLDDVRGRLSLLTFEDPTAFERAQYIHTVSNWSSWLSYQAYLKSHKDDAPQS